MGAWLNLGVTTSPTTALLTHTTPMLPQFLLQKGDSALHAAAIAGNVDGAQFLMDEGMDPNVQNMVSPVHTFKLKREHTHTLYKETIVAAITCSFLILNGICSCAVTIQYNTIQCNTVQCRTTNRVCTWRRCTRGTLACAHSSQAAETCDSRTRCAFQHSQQRTHARKGTHLRAPAEVLPTI